MIGNESSNDPLSFLDDVLAFESFDSLKAPDAEKLIGSLELIHIEKKNVTHQGRTYEYIASPVSAQKAAQLPAHSLIISAPGVVAGTKQALQDAKNAVFLDENGEPLLDFEASLGKRNVQELTVEQVARVQQIHLIALRILNLPKEEKEEAAPKAEQSGRTLRRQQPTINKEQITVINAKGQPFQNKFRLVNETAAIAYINQANARQKMEDRARAKEMAVDSRKRREPFEKKTLNRTKNHRKAKRGIRLRRPPSHENR